MSRIHEALKKAAQERSAQLAAEIVPDLARVAAEVQRPVLMTSQLSEPTPRGVRASEVPSNPRFDELARRSSHPKWQLDPQMNVFQKTASGRIGAERFRTLRSRLYQIASTHPLRRVLITSSVSGEGKTFVAANLAQSIVHQPDRRVLLIDADLRASRLHSSLGAPASPGLTDYLRGEADEYKVMQFGIEGNLCFIPGGTQVSNPSELLLSDRMKNLLDLVTPAFDWIIVDSPPALLVHDASSLADLCDGVLFVVKAGSTDFKMAVKGASEFRDKNVLGVVLNRVEKAESYGSAYYAYPDNEDAPEQKPDVPNSILP
jgi:protein-tyrosine kinase